MAGEYAWLNDMTRSGKMTDVERLRLLVANFDSGEDFHLTRADRNAIERIAHRLEMHREDTDA